MKLIKLSITLFIVTGLLSCASNQNMRDAKQKQHFQEILASWKKQLQLEQDRTADKIQKKC